MIVQDIILKASELVDNAIAANSIYPNTEERLQLRKKYLQQAAINAYQLVNKFEVAEKVVVSDDGKKKVNANSLSNISSLLFDEINLLKGSYQNAKIIKQ